MQNAVFENMGGLKHFMQHEVNLLLYAHCYCGIENARKLLEFVCQFLNKQSATLTQRVIIPCLRGDKVFS